MTAEGKLRTCLFSMTETDLRGPLRSGASDDELEAIIRAAVWEKELKHHVNDEGFVQPAAHHVADRRMKDLDEALALVLDGLAPLAAESVSLRAAAGRRVIARRARAAIDLPPFDRTAMDGFAVRAADVAPGAELRVIGDLAAGGATADARARDRGADLDRRGDPARAPTRSCASRTPRCATAVGRRRARPRRAARPPPRRGPARGRRALAARATC